MKYKYFMGIKVPVHHQVDEVPSAPQTPAVPDAPPPPPLVVQETPVEVSAAPIEAIFESSALDSKEEPEALKTEESVIEPGPESSDSSEESDEEQLLAELDSVVSDAPKTVSAKSKTKAKKSKKA